MLLFCLDLPDFFLEERDSASESAQAVSGFPERFIRGGTGLSRDFLPESVHPAFQILCAHVAELLPQAVCLLPDGCSYAFVQPGSAVCTGFFHSRFRAV